MKTLILTGSDERMLNVLDLTLPSKQEYCKKHNYDLLSLRSFHADTEDIQNNFNSYNIGFLRVLIAFKQLRYYDNVMWIDADSIITNMEYKIEDFILNDACFIASYDWMHFNSFSTGNFIIRKTSNMQSLIDKFISVSQNRLSDVMQEQGALNQIYTESNEYKEMFNILPHKFLGGVPNIVYDTASWSGRWPLIDPWTPDFFLAHLTGMTAEERVEILSNNKLNLK